jgi:acyl dehydratase
LATDTSSNVGKTWKGFTYEVGLEKIREYANAIGESTPVHHDREAATQAGFRDVVAPPMFAVVYSAGAMGPVLFDPEVGMDFARMLHGSQQFVWGEPVCAGDAITTDVEWKDLSEKDGKQFFVFESVSRNGHGDEVVRGTWTNIVRGG